MSELDPVPLAADETIRKAVPAGTSVTLVSDGNSRWAEADGVLYFITNGNYKAPDVEA